VDPVPDPLLLRKSGSAGNLTRTSGFIARNSDLYTTEAVICTSIHPLKILGQIETDLEKGDVCEYLISMETRAARVHICQKTVLMTVNTFYFLFQASRFSVKLYQLLRIKASTYDMPLNCYKC
jgi:hypothetical protein